MGFMPQATLIYQDSWAPMAEGRTEIINEASGGVTIPESPNPRGNGGLPTLQKDVLRLQILGRCI